MVGPNGIRNVHGYVDDTTFSTHVMKLLRPQIRHVYTCKTQCAVVCKTEMLLHPFEMFSKNPNTPELKAKIACDGLIALWLDSNPFVYFRYLYYLGSIFSSTLLFENCKLFLFHF